MISLTANQMSKYDHEDRGQESELLVVVCKYDDYYVPGYWERGRWQHGLWTSRVRELPGKEIGNRIFTFFYKTVFQVKLVDDLGPGVHEGAGHEYLGGQHTVRDQQGGWDDDIVSPVYDYLKLEK